MCIRLIFSALRKLYPFVAIAVPTLRCGVRYATTLPLLTFGSDLLLTVLPRTYLRQSSVALAAREVTIIRRLNRVLKLPVTKIAFGLDQQVECL